MNERSIANFVSSFSYFNTIIDNIDTFNLSDSILFDFNLFNATFFNSNSINQEKVPAQVEYRIATCNTGNLQECFYQVPEDTRFEVRADFSDNVTGENLLGSISIGSGFCSGKAVMENLASSNGLSLVDTEDQLVPDTKGLGYQYQDKSFYKRFHVYPRQNKYDEMF